MRAFVVKDERNLAALRGRVLRKDVPAEDADAAEAAIRAANPHLDVDQLKPGAVVVLPDHPAIAVHAGQRPGSRTLADARTTVAAARDAVSGAATATHARHAALRNALSAPEVARAAAEDPAIREGLSRATEALAAAQRRVDQWKSDVAAALEGWEADLDALTRR